MAKAKTAGVGSGVKKLYRAPLDEFTERRNDLAKRLRDRGDDEEAREVKSLKRPTIAAWTVDQLAHEQRSKVNKLVRAVEKITKERSQTKVRKAMDVRRDLVADLVEDAEKILEDAGRNMTPQTRTQVAQTLTSATSTHELALLKSGTFTRPLSGSGFDQAFGIAPAKKPSKAEQRLREQLEEVTDELKRRKKERDAADKEARRAERELKEAEQEAASAERAVQRLEDKEKHLKRKLR